MSTYPKPHQDKQKKLQTIKNILINNKYHTHILNSHHKTPYTIDTQQNKSDQYKLAIFTYIGNETRNISKLFKRTSLKISFKTTNTIKHQLKPKTTTNNKYVNSGIYQLKCHTCQLKYIGQTGRPFKIRFIEHSQATKSNTNNSMHSQHIPNSEHSYGLLDSTIDILHIVRKGKYMNTLEKFYIYKTRKQGTQQNDAYTGTHS
jgi:hypothetical protein